MGNTRKGGSGELRGDDTTISSQNQEMTLPFKIKQNKKRENEQKLSGKEGKTEASPEKIVKLGVWGVGTWYGSHFM